MKLFLICVVILAALVVLWLAAGAICFRIAIVRASASAPSDYIKGVRAKYRDTLMAGEAWIRSQVTERVSITSSDGLQLSARLYLHPEAKGILLFFHGYRSSADIDASGAAEYYYNLGYSLLLPDQRSHGQSQGRFITFGIREKDDCVLWSRWCARRFGDDCPQILSGLSMGATTVLMAAGQKLPDSVRCIIADCGFSSPADILRKVIRSDYHVPPIIILPAIAFYAKHRAGFSIDAYSTYTAMETNALPVLFVHGLADAFVPCEMTEACYARCTAPKRLVLVEGAGHGLSFLVDTPRLKKELQDFLSRYVS